MSTFKYKTIKKKKDIIREVKCDLWGEVLMFDESTKYRRIYTKLFDKKRRRFPYKLRKSHLMKYYKVVNNKLVSRKFFTIYSQRKKALQFHSEQTNKKSPKKLVKKKKKKKKSLLKNFVSKGLMSLKLHFFLRKLNYEKRQKKLLKAKIKKIKDEQKKKADLLKKVRRANLIIKLRNQALGNIRVKEKPPKRNYFLLMKKLSEKKRPVRQKSKRALERERKRKEARSKKVKKTREEREIEELLKEPKKKKEKKIKVYTSETKLKKKKIPFIQYMMRRRRRRKKKLFFLFSYIKKKVVKKIVKGKKVKVKKRILMIRIRVRKPKIKKIKKIKRRNPLYNWYLWRGQQRIKKMKRAKKMEKQYYIELRKKKKYGDDYIPYKQQVREKNMKKADRKAAEERRRIRKETPLIVDYKKLAFIIHRKYYIKKNKKLKRAKIKKIIFNSKFSRIRKLYLIRKARNQFNILNKIINLIDVNYRKSSHFKNRYDREYLLRNKRNNNYFLKKYGKIFFKKLNFKEKDIFEIKKKGEIRQYKSIFNFKSIRPFEPKKKSSKYAKAIRLKKKLQRYLGNVSSKRLKKIYLWYRKRKIKRQRGNFFLTLESTLFYTILRSKLILNQYYLKNLIKKGFVLVNGKVIVSLFYKLNPYDRITFLPEKKRELKIVFGRYAVSKVRRPLSNFMVSYCTFSILLLDYPKLEELTYSFKSNYNIFKRIYFK